MKKGAYFISLAALFLAACGSNSGTGIAVAEEGSVTTKMGLGNCDESNEGVTKLVTSENQNYTCTDGDWEVSTSKVNSVKTKKGLGDCDESKEGDVKLVSSEETYYKCVDGEWVESEVPKSSASTKSSSSDEDIYDGSSRHGIVVIDENNSLIKPYLQDAVKGCFMNGYDFSWKTVELAVDQLSYKYEFVGDTLVLHSGKSFSEYGIMFVGGKEGNLNGTWQSTLCSYDHEEEETTCYKLCSEVKASVLRKFDVTSENELDEVDREDFEEEYYKKRQKTPCFEDYEITDVTIKISGDDITMITKDRETEEKEFTDYMNSEYISDLYYAIYEGYTSAPSFYDLFVEDSADVKSYRRKADIEEKKKTKESVTFIVAEEDTVSVKVNTVSIDKENGKLEVGMVVKSGKRTCELNNKSGRVNKGDCNADNLAYFDEPSKIEGEDGSIYRKVSYMEDSNAEDFNSCVGEILRTIAKNSSSDDDDADDLCSEVMSAYDFCVEELMDYGYTRSEATSVCEMNYDVDDYCGLAKTATSTGTLSMSKFKKNRMAQILELLDLFK